MIDNMNTNNNVLSINKDLQINKENISEIILKKGNGRCNKIIFEMPEISLDKVITTYNGKPGCMCGCLGKYSYLENTREQASKNRGYKVSDDEINERSVMFIINKLKKEAHRGIEVTEDYIYYLEIENRCYALYLKK